MHVCFPRFRRREETQTKYEKFNYILNNQYFQQLNCSSSRFVMLVKTFYFPIDVLLVLLQVKVTKLDNTRLVRLILSSIALFVKNVIDSVSVQPLILDAVCPTIRAT